MAHPAATKAKRTATVTKGSFDTLSRNRRWSYYRPTSGHTIDQCKSVVTVKPNGMYVKRLKQGCHDCNMRALHRLHADSTSLPTLYILDARNNLPRQEWAP